jgi:tetrahydromethanopterin S-methyltransferase subunit C
MLAWWYVCIGGAFILLAVRSALRGDRLWQVIIRLVIAIGFVALAAGTFRGPSR